MRNPSSGSCCAAEKRLRDKFSARPGKGFGTHARYEVKAR